MFERKYIYNVIILVIVLSSLLFLLLWDFGNITSLLLNEITNFGHIPLFGTASIIFIWIMNEKKWPVRNRIYYVFSFSATIVLGVSTEYLQNLTPGRDFEVLDIAYDALGSLCFLTVVYPSRSQKPLLLNKIKLLAVGLMILASIPLHLAIIGTWMMHREFPLLGSFETRLERYRWGSNGADFDFLPIHATNGSLSMRVHSKPGIYPGIVLKHFPSDWSKYKSLSFDVFIEGDMPLTIITRINDALHDQTFNDRFNKRFVLTPGYNHIVIDLKEVWKAPHTRTMSMAKITEVVIFSYFLSEERTLYLDDLRLK